MALLRWSVSVVRLRVDVCVVYKSNQRIHFASALLIHEGSLKLAWPIFLEAVRTPPFVTCFDCCIIVCVIPYSCLLF